MKYELETLEKLVQHDIEPSKLNLNKIDEKEYDHWISFVNNEAHRIKNSINKAVFKVDREQQIELYIQQHQQALIRLTDHLIGYFYPEEESILFDDPEDHNIIKLYKYIYKCLEDLLTYIETYFSKFFSQETKIPNSYKILAVWNIKKLLPDIRKRFTDKEIDEQLIEIITSPLNRFINRKNQDNATFRYLIYLKELLKELDELSYSKAHTTELNFKILGSLTYLNFNSLRFFNYCTKSIKQYYQKQDTLQRQLEKLAWVYKNLNQVQVKPDFAFKPTYESLKTSLIKWVENEIHFLETRQQLSLNLTIQKKDRLENSTKIYTNMSVSQLAYLVKLFHKSGIIQNNNQHDLLKLVARSFKTKRAETISPHSLRIKYYNVDNSTEMAVKDILANLQKNIDDN